MRHLFLPAAAIAVAFWLGPAFAHDRMSGSRKIGTVVVVTAIFLVIWLVLDRRAKAKKKREAEASSGTGRWGVLSHVTPIRRGR